MGDDIIAKFEQEYKQKVKTDDIGEIRSVRGFISWFFISCSTSRI